MLKLAMISLLHIYLFVLTKAFMGVPKYVLSRHQDGLCDSKFESYHTQMTAFTKYDKHKEKTKDTSLSMSGTAPVKDFRGIYSIENEEQHK